MAGGGCSYRGADRRGRQGGVETNLSARDLWKQAALVPLGVLLSLGLLLYEGTTPAAMSSAMEIITALASVAAGVAMLVCWKIGGRAAPGWIGVALTDFGLLFLAYHSLGFLRVQQPASVEPYGRLLVCCVASGALIAALRSPEVDSGLRPLRLVGVSGLLGVLCLALVQQALSSGDRELGSLSLQTATIAASGLVWLTSGLYALTLMRRKYSATRMWVASFALVMAVSHLGAEVLGDVQWGSVLTQLGFLLASAVALVGARSEFTCTVKGQDRYALGLRTVLDDTRAEMRREQTELDERLHDLRNAVSALRSADSTLRRYSERLDDATKTSLADALTSELSRLQALIEPGRKAESIEFSLASAINPVLSVERTRGTEIDAQIDPTMVMGNPDGLAQALQNLLTNARQYAPGSPVTVRSHRIGDRIVVVVSDEGPGIPEHERSSVFDRGYRGSAGGRIAGSGIGLHVASHLLHEMGGGLELADGTDRGASFIIDLPAAPAALLPSSPGNSRIYRPFEDRPPRRPRRQAMSS